MEPLVAALDDKGLSVWYDRKIFRLGDSIRGKIDEGLAGTRFGVVVLSETYARKQWTKTELGALMARESDGEKVILPIWHGVGTADVKRLFPTLADRIAVSSGDGIDACIEAILDALSGETSLNPAHVQTTGGIGLGQEERDILLAAVAGDGYVMSAGHKQGHNVQAGGRKFTENADERTIEKYKAAVRKLVERRHLEPQGHKNEVFKVSHEGYEAADTIRGEVVDEPVERPDWGESLARYQQDFPEAKAFLSISNAFARTATVGYDEFRETLINRRLHLGDIYGWPWFGPPPEGMNPERQRRRGVRIPYFERYYWDLLESGDFLFCTNKLTWNDGDTEWVGVRTLLYHLLVDLTFAGRIAAAFGVSGSGGKVQLSLHGVRGRKLHCQADLQTVFPECTDDNPTAPLVFDFSSNPDSIREAAIDVVYELLTYFPQPHDGNRLIHRNQLEQPARDIQRQNGLLEDA